MNIAFPCAFDCLVSFAFTAQLISLLLRALGTLKPQEPGPIWDLLRVRWPHLTDFYWSSVMFLPFWLAVLRRDAKKVLSSVHPGLCGNATTSHWAKLIHQDEQNGLCIICNSCSKCINFCLGIYSIHKGRNKVTKWIQVSNGCTMLLAVSSLFLSPAAGFLPFFLAWSRRLQAVRNCWSALKMSMFNITM